MDALKFIEERNRMCDYYRGGDALSGCAECPAFQMACSSVKLVAAEYIDAVEQWSREHPRKTRQDVFLGQWPRAPRGKENVLVVCPKQVDVNSSCVSNDGGKQHFKDCGDCFREFWMQEVE